MICYIGVDGAATVIGLKSHNREREARFSPPSLNRGKARIMSDFGQEDGQTCWRNGCKGVISLAKQSDCSCHIAPPCGHCVEPKEYCPECDWHAKDDEQVSYRHLGGGISEMLTGPQPRPLDPRKIDYRITTHTNASQLCEGVYPEGATREDVERRVRGTFGGRFERFGDGKFKYVAYTD